MSTGDLQEARWARLARLGVNHLEGFNVLISGAGRAGATLAMNLVRYPFAQITVIDPDTASDRDAGTLFRFGSEREYKVRILQEFFAFWKSPIKFNPVIMKIDDTSFQRFIDLVHDHDILVCAFDDWKIWTKVCLHAHDFIPMVGISMAEEGAYAEVAWSYPRHTPTLAQTLVADRKVSVSGSISLPGDVDAAVNVARDVMLGVLLVAKKGYDLFEGLLDPSAPLLIVHNRTNSFTRSDNPFVPRMVRLLPGT